MQNKNRWITALILIPLVLGILWTENALVLGALVCVAAMLAFFEYWTIITAWQDDSEKPAFEPVPILLISGVNIVTMALGTIYASVQGLLFALWVNLILMSTFTLWRFVKQTASFNVLAFQLFGLVYIFVPLCLVMAIQDFDQGSLWILWILIVTFINDTAAFYVGTTWGKHKLAPAISPKKSVEGALGGIAASLVLGFVFALIFFQSLSLALHLIPCAIILPVLGQLGDFMESAMKRRAGIKDSGKILPGHGGILDRIDGLLFTLPFAYGYLVFII